MIITLIRLLVNGTQSLPAMIFTTFLQPPPSIIPTPPLPALRPSSKSERKHLKGVWGGAKIGDSDTRTLRLCRQKPFVVVWSDYGDVERERGCGFGWIRRRP